jgi:hypothetical protein
MTRPRWCAAACLGAALVTLHCGDDGGVEVCTGTCITVSNASTLTVDEVNFTACGVSGWGANRLGSGEIAPGEERSWAVTAGCYDVQAVAEVDGWYCGHTEYGVDIADGTTHVLQFTDCE